MFIEEKDDGGGGDNWTTGAISRAKLQSNHHHQQTNIQFFTGRMPFLSPNQQCQSTEGEKYHIPWTCLPQAHLGVFQLWLTTNSSWLPCGRVAMLLISPLMPVPHLSAYLQLLYTVLHLFITCDWHLCDTGTWTPFNPETVRLMIGKLFPH